MTVKVPELKHCWLLNGADLHLPIDTAHEVCRRAKVLWDVDG